jgi:hypothetical protein
MEYKLRAVHLTAARVKIEISRVYFSGAIRAAFCVFSAKVHRRAAPSARPIPPALPSQQLSKQVCSKRIAAGREMAASNGTPQGARAVPLVGNPIFRARALMCRRRICVLDRLMC